MYEDEVENSERAETLQAIVVDCEENVRIADDFILSRTKGHSDLLESLGDHTAVVDFANKYPFIDGERAVVSPSDEESESIMPLEQMKKLDIEQLQSQA